MFRGWVAVLELHPLVSYTVACSIFVFLWRAFAQTLITPTFVHLTASSVLFCWMHGQGVWSEGRIGSLSSVLSGSGEEERVVTLFELQPHEYFGDVPLLLNCPANHSAVAGTSGAKLKVG